MVALTVESWFGIEKLELRLDRPLNLLVAGHEEGKSALREAICFVLTGTLRTRTGVTKKQQIPQVAIRKGASKAKVTLHLADIAIERSVTRSGQTLAVKWDGDELTGTAAQEAIYAALGIDEDQVVAALDSWRFFDLDDAGRRKLLFQTLGRAITEDHVREALLGRGLDEKAVAELLAIEDGGFRTWEKCAVEKRRVAKRDLDDLRQHAEPSWIHRVGDIDYDLRTAAIDEIEKRLAGIRSERDKAIAAKAGIAASAKALLEAAEEEAGPLREKLQEYDAERGDGYAETLQAERARAAEPIPALEARIDELEAKRDVAEGVLLVLENLRRPDSCPVLGTECLATDAAIRRKRGEIAKEAEGAQATVDDVGDRVPKLREQLDAARGRVAALDTQIPTAVREREEMAARRERLAELDQQIGQCRDRLRDHQPTEAPSDVAQLDARIRAGESLLQAKRDYDRESADAEERRAKIAEHEATRDAWDAIAQALKPEGVESDLIRSLVPALCETIDQVAVPSGVGQVRVSPEDLRFYVARGEETYTDLQLSRSARLRVGIAIQHALASMAGFPILVIDELDVFDPAARAAVVGALLDCAPRYAAVLGLATLKIEEPRAPEHESIGMWWLRGGAVEEVR